MSRDPREDDQPDQRERQEAPVQESARARAGARRPRPRFEDGSLTRIFKFPSKSYPRSSYYVTGTEIIIRIKKGRKKWKLVVPKRRLVATNRWFTKPRWVEIELTFVQAVKLGLAAPRSTDLDGTAVATGPSAGDEPSRQPTIEPAKEMASEPGGQPAIGGAVLQAPAADESLSFGDDEEAEEADQVSLSADMDGEGDDGGTEEGESDIRSGADVASAVADDAPAWRLGLEPGPEAEPAPECSQPPGGDLPPETALEPQPEPQPEPQVGPEPIADLTPKVEPPPLAETAAVVGSTAAAELVPPSVPHLAPFVEARRAPGLRSRRWTSAPMATAAAILALTFNASVGPMPEQAPPHWTAADTSCTEPMLATGCAAPIITGSIDPRAPLSTPTRAGEPPAEAEPVPKPEASPEPEPEASREPAHEVSPAPLLQAEPSPAPEHPAAPETVAAEPGPAPALVDSAPSLPVAPLSGHALCRALPEAARSISIRFDSASALVDLPALGQIETLGRQLGSCPWLHATIEGHTDSDGTAARNDTLSMRRAEAVRRLLIEAGARPEQVRAVGLGQSRPYEPNVTPENKRRNRRAAIVVEAMP